MKELEKAYETLNSAIKQEKNDKGDKEL